jgi:hypothetical protein
MGPESLDGQSAAEMSVEERRTELRAREEPPPEREWTAGKAQESLPEGQNTLGGGCDPPFPTQPLREGEETSVEGRRTELEAREEPPLER